VESVELETLQCNTPYKGDFSIKNFDRATIVASQYEFYRCTKVEYMWTALYNTFQDASGQATIPYLVWSMNRNGEDYGGVFDKRMLERRGAIPQKFVGVKNVSYVPNTLQGTIATHGLIPGEVMSQAFTYTPKKMEWFSSEVLKTSSGAPTGPNEFTVAPPMYYGLLFIIDELSGNFTAPIGRLTIKCHWEFKQSRALDNTTNDKVIPYVNTFQING